MFSSQCFVVVDIKIKKTFFCFSVLLLLTESFKSLFSLQKLPLIFDNFLTFFNFGFDARSYDQKTTNLNIQITNLTLMNKYTYTHHQPV